MITPRPPRPLTIIVAILALTLVSTAFAAQRRATKKKPTSPPPPAPPTLKSCGISLHIPPGWELMHASEYEAKHPEPESDSQPKAAPESIGVTSALESSSQIAPAPENPCSFVLAPKYPSELVRNTDAEGPVGRMELEIVNADLDTAAAQLFEKDEKGWYATGPNGTRYDARLTKQRRGRLQILTAVIVEACHDLSGKYRSLCESNRYVYSNGRRSVLISTGPYLGETESTILNSIRFAPIPKPRKKR